MPNDEQLKDLYRLSYFLTYVAFQPIHIVCVDQRTNNVYVLAGHTESTEFQISTSGKILP